MSNNDSKATQRLNLEKATAIITFRGLGLSYFNSRGQFEDQLLRRRDHDYTFEIHENGKPVVWTKRDFNPEENFDITVVNPEREGSFRFQRGRFHPLTKDENDPYDFRWFVDAEGPRLHRKRLQKRVPREIEQSGNRLQQIRISDATYFTATLSEEPFARQRLQQFLEVGVFIGWIARDVGATITCRDEAGSGIRITNPSSDKSIWLPRKEDAQYQILIENRCPITIGPDGPTDFVLYYEVMQDPTLVRYDLRRAVLKGDPRAKAPIKGLDDWLVDGGMVMCDRAYLSRTSEWS